jgi:hypothetical protein
VLEDGVDTGGGSASGIDAGGVSLLADGAGAFLAAGTGTGLANMLAQLLVVPPGITLLEGRSEAVTFC